MALNVTATTVDTYINTALSSITSGDYSAARKAVVQARVAIMAKRFRWIGDEEEG